MLKDDNIEYPGIAEDDLTPTQADTKGQPATTEIADPGAGVGRPHNNSRSTSRDCT